MQTVTKIRLTEPQLCQFLKISTYTLRYYLAGWRFSKIGYDLEGITNNKTKRTTYIRVYKLTEQQLADLRDFKEIRRHKSGILG
jgi:hypothetical protein